MINKESAQIIESISKAKTLVQAAIKNVDGREAQEIRNILSKSSEDTAEWRSHLMKVLWETSVYIEDTPPYTTEAFWVVLNNNIGVANQVIANLPSEVNPIFYGPKFINYIQTFYTPRLISIPKHRLALFEAIGPKYFMDVTCGAEIDAEAYYADYKNDFTQFKSSYLQGNTPLSYQFFLRRQMEEYKTGNPTFKPSPSSINTTPQPTKLPLDELGYNIDKSLNIRYSMSDTSSAIVMSIMILLDDTRRLGTLLTKKDLNTLLQFFLIAASEGLGGKLAKKVIDALGENGKEDVKVLLHHVGCDIPEVDEHYILDTYKLRKQQLETLELLIKIAEDWEDFNNVLKTISIIDLLPDEIYDKLNSKLSELIKNISTPPLNELLSIACDTTSKGWVAALLIHNNYEALKNDTLEFDIGYAVAVKLLTIKYPGLKLTPNNSKFVDLINTCKTKEELEGILDEWCREALVNPDADRIKALLELHLVGLTEIEHSFFANLKISEDMVDKNGVLKDSKYRDFISTLQEKCGFLNDKQLLQRYNSTPLYQKVYAVLFHPNHYPPIADLLREKGVEEKHINYMTVLYNGERYTPQQCFSRAQKDDLKLAEKSMLDHCVKRAMLCGVVSFAACKLGGYMFASSSIAQFVAENSGIITLSLAGFVGFYQLAENIGPALYVNRYS